MRPPPFAHPSATPAVRARDLRVVHAGGTEPVVALDGVDLDVAAGTFLAVMGPSGSGKSTLVACLAGLEVPQSGSVQVAGVDLEAIDETRRTRFRRDTIGTVLQQAHLVPYLSAAENVELPLRLARRRVRRSLATALLAQVGLGDRVDHLPGELSGGQLQRVALARALAGDPAVILADEPTGALDTRSARDVLALLRQCVDRDGRTLIMVTHDPSAAAVADACVFLVDGRVVGRTLRPTAEEVARQLAHLDELVGA